MEGRQERKAVSYRGYQNERIRSRSAAVLLGCRANEARDGESVKGDGAHYMGVQNAIRRVLRVFAPCLRFSIS